MKIIAHRGNKHVAPENTLVAFESAAKAGTDMIETDIYPCATGEIVIMHDDDVSGTTNGTGNITELTFQQVRALDAGSKFAPTFAGQKVPTLAELLELYQRYPKLELLLEFKGIWNTADAQRVIDALAAAGINNRVVVESFFPQTVAVLQQVAPHLPRGLLVEPPILAKIHAEFGDPIELCHQLGAEFLNPGMEVLAADPEFISRAHKAGLGVMVWTANQPSQWEMLLANGVEGVCTDRPEFLAGWLAGKGGLDD